MNVGRAICLAILCAAVVLGCALPSSPATAASTASSSNPTTPGTPSGGASFSLSTDTSRNVGVLTSPSGMTIDLSAVEPDGSVVACTAPTSVTQLDSSGGPGTTTGTGTGGTSSGGSSRSLASAGGSWTVLVTGTRGDGRPGAWIVSSNRTVQPLVNSQTGQATSCLADSDDGNGVFHRMFGWSYHVVATAENGKLIAGYAEATRDFSRGSVKIDKGTTVGVYWRVWKHSTRSFFLVSQARVIGLLDPSEIPTRGERAHRWMEWLRRHLPPGLRFFLLDYMSSYLTMVDKSGVHYDSTANQYTVNGTDQDALAAVATINDTGVVSIVETTTAGPVDLVAGRLTVASANVADGGTVSVTLSLANQQSGAVSTSFAVDFHMALTSTFNATTDPTVGTATVSGIGGNATQSVSATLTIPAGSLNQDVYLYANVDPAAAVTETNRANNVSTATNAAVALVYDSSNSSRRFPVLLETYAPSGSGSVDTIMALYRNVSGSPVFQGLVSNDGGPGGYAVINTGAGLSSGTYYVVVTEWSSGPYAFAARTSGIDRAAFTPLASNTVDANEPDDTPQVWPVTGNPPSLPAKPLAVPVGTMANRYAGSSDWDWFTFTLP